jgi:hypothetical protein
MEVNDDIIRGYYDFVLKYLENNETEIPDNLPIIEHPPSDENLHTMDNIRKAFATLKTDESKYRPIILMNALVDAIIKRDINTLKTTIDTLKTTIDTLNKLKQPIVEELTQLNIELFIEKQPSDENSKVDLFGFINKFSKFDRIRDFNEDEAKKNEIREEKIKQLPLQIKETEEKLKEKEEKLKETEEKLKETEKTLKETEEKLYSIEMNESPEKIAFHFMFKDNGISIFKEKYKQISGGALTKRKRRKSRKKKRRSKKSKKIVRSRRI